MRLVTPARAWVMGTGALALVGLLGGCGQPTAQVVRPPDGQISFEVPVEFADLGEGDNQGLLYGLPGSSSTELSNKPILFMGVLSAGDSASYQGLRQIITGGEFDPRAEPPLPKNAQLIGYTEINQADVWGVRLRMAIGSGVTDFQALVHRASDQVIVTELTCTQACFVEQADLINQIQGSWSLEP